MLIHPLAVRPQVVPLAGTWIETRCPVRNTFSFSSFPSRERGLKQLYGTDGIGGEAVVPLAGTWIETLLLT